MRWLRGLLLLALGAAGALGAQAALRDSPPPRPDRSPSVPDREPTSPQEPPVVWIDGEIQDLTAARVTIRDGRGPEVRLRRFAGGATSFLRLEQGRWRALEAGEITALGTGRQACVESLLDGRTLLALRVFLGVECGPFR